MLRIQVLGKGLIPRGLGLAPRKEPFMADFTLIATILATPGLKVNMLHPEDGHAIELTNNNLKRNWDKYANYQKKANTPAAPQTAPVAPIQTPAAPQTTEYQNVDEKVPEKVEEKVEEKSQQDHTNQNQAQKYNNNNQYQGNKNQNGQKNGNNNSFKPVTNDGKNK